MVRPWLTFYEREVPSHIDYPVIPLTRFYQNAACEYPDNTSMIFYGNKITYREGWDHIRALSTALHKLGVNKGDRVSIYLPNSPQFVISFYAVLRLGGIVVQTNPMYVPRELEHILNDSEAETIITLDLLYDRVKAVKDKTRIKRIIVTSIKDFLPPHLKLLYPLQYIGKKKPEIDYNEPGVYKFSDLLQTKSEKIDVKIDPKEDIALFQYTGGTTGISKAAMLTHYNLVANTIQAVSWLSDHEEGKEVLMAVLPFFHVYGMTVGMNFAIYLASTLILVPRFNVKEVVKLLAKYKVTLFPGAPTIYIAVINYKDVKKYDLTSIKACISGSAPLPVKVKEDFEKLTGAKLVEGYGLSEASPVTHCNPIYGLNKPGSIGIPFPDTDAKIVDLETGEKEMPVGEAGELIVKGPQIMKGYWNMPEETARVLRNGWLYTGDIARMDKDGYFYIVDRKKEMIIASGYNIYPREIEEVLYRHPKIKEAAVVGIPSGYRGETVKAYIVLKEGETATDDEIKQYCRENLARYKVPEIIEFRDELPRSAVGKVLKRVLLEEELKKKL